jgi:hypothetical protein
MGRSDRFWFALVCAAVTACSDGDTQPAERAWSKVASSEHAALLSVHGTAADDVWMAGADDGSGPVVLHWDGSSWQRHHTQSRGDLWWVHATAEGAVYFGGSDASVLRYSGGEFERLRAPGLGKHTVYGVWAASASDVYAVGAAAGRNGFVWHFDGSEFRELPLPVDLPTDAARDTPGLFKVWGRSAEDVWIVGGRGVVLRGNANDGFRRIESGTDVSLFTVHASGDRVVIVGGEGEGVVLEPDGDALVNHGAESAPLLQGACVDDKGTAWAVGLGGSIYRGKDSKFVAVDSGIDVTATQSLHAVWVDPSGGVWAVGGNALSPELDAGLALHWGGAIAEHQVEAKPVPAAECPEVAVDPSPGATIARRWNEQLLNAIRRDIPRPTVHARNLFHASVAMWDAWAAYDGTADAYLVSERHSANDIAAARQEAISYATYRVLSHRYAPAVGGAVSQACFDAFMTRLGYDPKDARTAGDDARAFGNRLGMAIVAEFAGDGANESDNYAAGEPYVSPNADLLVDKPGTVAQEPAQWQRLILAEAVTQNGIPAGSGAQGYIGAHWGGVTPFALTRPEDGAAYLDIGVAPTTLSADLVDAVVEVIGKSAELDPSDGALIDVSPGAYGNNSLGANDGAGHALNPVTGNAYAPQIVKRGDFTRVLAEFWADGPASETPPGHWNTLANQVADHGEFVPRLFGRGEALDPLAWDVAAYFVLNGALHDAAIAAWELKRKYTTARPITLVRYMGALGQRTDPAAPSYHPEGLPLVPELIEVITAQSSAPGERHAHLARYLGEIAVRAWRGEPGDREHELGGTAFVRAVEWLPYQRRTFVTPAFPGYVSGHSTFSRAAAVVLSELTGSEFFPGGLGRSRFEPGYLVFEAGPSAPIELQWATYFDAADQAGQSRIWGGIHVRHDDYDGRRIGAEVGARALQRARAYFAGTARP